jgi:hypothetical protein
MFEAAAVGREGQYSRYIDKQYLPCSANPIYIVLRLVKKDNLDEDVFMII